MLAELAAQLVSVDSVNPGFVAGGAGEAAVAQIVAGTLERAGLEVTLQETAPGRPNVIGIRRGTGWWPDADAQRAHGHGRALGGTGALDAEASRTTSSLVAVHTT